VGLRSNGIRIAKKQLSYGIQIYLGGLLIFLYEPFSKILVAQFIGVAEVGIFDIGLKVRDQIYRFISKLLYPLFPLISKLTDREKIRNIVHDVEQKIFFVMLPLIAIILLTAKSLVALFFHSNVDAISITIACVLSGYLIGSITVFPIYQYLIIKGHAPKTILIQCINVFTNAIVFLILYNWLGYYAAVIATSVAILTSCGVLIYYQKKYLNSLIFDSIQQIIVIFVTFLVALIFGFFFNSILGSSIWKLVFNPVIIISTTIVFYRRFALINIADISRYFGYNNIFSKVFIYVLCRNKG
jgi:O-antigen/teichoic acid export membrane protein